MAEDNLTAQTVSAWTDTPVPDGIKTIPARHELGQFFTPQHVAELMASFFRAGSNDIELLDAGAGTGALTSAVVKRVCKAERRPKRIAVTAYEVDATIIDQLK